ncbi:hypothetical protein ACCO45_007178 [Purpureocillium lilacinum]|uniref:Uncharacterized protein n=1 Tax=Purpureocillium lilacinum TaxID=33203 RepID=A0ACC4DRX2_PURLI
MAARPGEENVATLFGDVHYFYASPDVKPHHHRFDKGSYVYLFENATERRCRIEVANNPSTDDQDAFDGCKSNDGQTWIKLEFATRTNTTAWSRWWWQIRLIRMNGISRPTTRAMRISRRVAVCQWGATRSPPSQVDVLDEPGPPPQPAAASSVVQRLERVAITDPQYGGTDAAATAPAHVMVQDSSPGGGSAKAAAEIPVASLPPPPPPPAANFAPMAYNPAAPAAPETIRHREKTPPPDEDPLNPLAVAVAYDYQKQPFTPGIPPPAQHVQVTSPGLPPPHFAGPPSHPGMQRAATMPVHQGMASPYGSSFPALPGFAPPPPPPQPASQPTPPRRIPAGRCSRQKVSPTIPIASSTLQCGS